MPPSAAFLAPSRLRSKEDLQTWRPRSKSGWESLASKASRHQPGFGLSQKLGLKRPKSRRRMVAIRFESKKAGGCDEPPAVFVVRLAAQQISGLKSRHRFPPVEAV